MRSGGIVLVIPKAGSGVDQHFAHTYALAEELASLIPTAVIVERVVGNPPPPIPGVRIFTQSRTASGALPRSIELVREAIRLRKDGFDTFFRTDITDCGGTARGHDPAGRRPHALLELCATKSATLARGGRPGGDTQRVAGPRGLPVGPQGRYRDGLSWPRVMWLPTASPRTAWQCFRTKLPLIGTERLRPIKYGRPGNASAYRRTLRWCSPCTACLPSGEHSATSQAAERVLQSMPNSLFVLVGGGH